MFLSTLTLTRASSHSALLCYYLISKFSATIENTAQKEQTMSALPKDTSALEEQHVMSNWGTVTNSSTPT